MVFIVKKNRGQADACSRFLNGEYGQWLEYFTAYTEVENGINLYIAYCFHDAAVAVHITFSYVLSNEKNMYLCTKAGVMSNFYKRHCRDVKDIMLCNRYGLISRME